MNEKTVRKQVLNMILETGVIDNGNVIGTLTHKTKMDGISGRDNIISALDTLERNGAIGVTRRGSHILKVYPKNKEGHVRSDRTDRSPAAKRESMFAKGVPSYLSDEMCSPVVVIKREGGTLVTPNDMPAKIQPTNKSDQDSTTKEQATEVSAPVKLSFLEELNLAYTGLRCRADAKTGILPVGSVHAFIMEDLKDQNITASRATKLNRTFADLHLRSSTVLGSSPKNENGRRIVRHQSTVDSTVDLITQEMLDSLKASPALREEADEAPVVESPTLAVPAESVAPPEDVTKKLVEIIKGLERDNQKVIDENYRLKGELETERTQNSKLTNEIARLKAVTVDPEAASILEKYNKS